MNERVVTVDVREDLRAGREPFGRIMGAIAGLVGHQSLRLIAPFQPTPLYAMLSQQGFTHKTKVRPDGSWEIHFQRGAAANTSSVTTTAPAEARSAPATDIIEVDARGLESPQPLVVILEAVERLPAGGALRARTDRRPMHLLPLLEERGFVGETQESPDGCFITDIRRR